jgi:hypothetical protein
MKFALVGDDPVVLPLLRVLAEHPDHTLMLAAFPGELQAEILNLIPSVRIAPGWEEMLTADLSAVIVCGSADVMGESAKQLAAAGRPLVVFPQGPWDTELIYELSLMRDDTGVKLIPISRRLLHPTFQNVRAEDIVHLRCEWEVQTPAGEEFPPESVRNDLLPDVGLLRFLGGEYHQVTAVHSATPTGGIVLATVTLSGENLPDAVWTLRPVTSPSRWQLTVARRAGTATFRGTGDAWQVVEEGNSEAPPWEAGPAVLEFIERSFANLAERPDWTDLTRDFEVLDAVRRSLTRRRTIDLHFETTSERSLFKTQMTAIGCGVLMLTLFAVIGLLILGSVLDARSSVEIAADKAGTIFYQHEFEPGGAELTGAGKEHWDRLEGPRRDPAMTPILVEQTGEEALSEARREFLVRLLRKEGVPNAEQRVEVHALKGPWLETVMKIARILVFLPLFLFLGLQLLLFITRPAQDHQKNGKNA